MPNKPCIIVHGGAFNIPDSYVKRYNDGTKGAAMVGYDTLTKVGSYLVKNVYQILGVMSVPVVP